MRMEMPTKSKHSVLAGLLMKMRQASSSESSFWDAARQLELMREPRDKGVRMKEIQSTQAKRGRD